MSESLQCINCVKTKDKELYYVKCDRCGGWKPANPSELTKLAKRKPK